MRVALVYDHLNKLGGAEVVLQAFHTLYPQADWYTSVWDKRRAPFSRDWQVHASWLNYLPYLRTHHELVPFLMPFIFESFDLSDYDLVISIGSLWSKGVITRADTVHLHYCLTPNRFLWSHRELYLTHPQFGLLQRIFTPVIKTIFSLLTKWDLVAATRPDHVISISDLVKKRVQKYYNRDSVVIYPPVDTTKFNPPHHHQSDYYLTVSRLVPYKNLELLINVFNQNHQKLVIVGTGSNLRCLQKLAKGNITFTGLVKEAELVKYYQGCRAFLQANVEDFGIAMVEALASGKPVIAYREGGAGEIVQDGVTGILVPEQSTASFLQALRRFETMQISPELCRESAKKFAKVTWRRQIQAYLEKAIQI